LYDWHGVKLAYEFSDRSLGAGRAVGRVAFALAATGMYYTNIGMLSSKIFTPPLNAEMLHDEIAEARRGADLMHTDPRSVPGLTSIIASAPKFATAHPAGFLPGNYALVDELRASAHVHPLAVAYLQMPMLHDLTDYTVYPTEMKDASGDVPVVGLARPDLHPELYKLEYWHDDAHLNEDGARLASSIAATELKTWYAAHGWPQPCEER
jgi:hypothetical protein